MLLVLAVGAAPRTARAFDLDVLAGPVVEQYVREVEADKRALTGPERKIDHELLRMLRHSTAPSGLGLQEPSPDPELRLSVHLRSAEAHDVRELGRSGLALERLDRETMQAEGRAQLVDVYRLAELPCVAALRPVHPGWLRVGSVTSEGDAASRATLVRAQGYDGSGIVVGVISDGVDHAADARSTGDLPSVTVPADSRCRPGSGDEGTALLEIVHDLAPGARLLFSSGSDSPMTFIDSVKCLAAAGANVIVDDLGFLDQPFFEDGSISAAVKAAIGAGVSYHSAAGNEANVHLEQQFRPSPTTNFHDFLGGPVDNSDDVSVGPFGTVTCILQWNDPFGASSNDYDLLALDTNLNVIAKSTNRQAGTQDPFETVSIFNPAPVPQTFKVAILKAAGESRLLKLFCLNATAEQYVTPMGSIVGQAALREAVAVGAIDVSDPGLDTVEAFSSQGPTRIFFPVPETRPKPDLVAFDGVSITNAGGFPRCPPACRFFGTSAAAPHSAAVAALLLSKNPFFTPADIQDLLRTTAVDIGPPGPDDRSGAGRIDALAAAEAAQCARDQDCADGNACTTDRCERARCRHDAVVCDDGDPCNGTETCNPATGCTPGTPLHCDDHEPCTNDTCVPLRGCDFAAVTGLESVTCWLEGIDDAVGMASASDVRSAVRERIGNAVKDLTTRIQLTAEAARAGDPKRESRMLHAARRSFGRLERMTTRARRHRGITRSLARTVRTRLARAKAELRLLQNDDTLGALRAAEAPLRLGTRLW